MSKQNELSAAYEYFNGDDLAATTWANKYALRDNQGNLLEKTPEDMHHRLAKGFAKIEEKYQWEHNHDKNLQLSEYGYKRQPLTEERIFELFNKFKYIIPAGSVMYGLNNSKPVSLSNCFVIASPSDSITGIFQTCFEQSSLFKRRGGVGFDISSLRPSNSVVNNSAHFSTGACSFMDLFSQVTNVIGEHNRRGALMISINIKHPDSKEFMLKKQDLTKVTGANISLQLDDDFIQAAQKEEDYFLRFPVDLDVSQISQEKLNSLEYDKLYGNEGEFKEYGERVYIRKIKAKEYWDSLIHCAWNTAEPGIIFRSPMINYTPDGVYDDYRMVSTNPCAEIAMEPYNSCRLMAINLTSIIINPFKKEAEIDWEKLYEISYEALQLGDDLVDLEIEAVNNILEVIKKSNDEREYELWNRINKEAKLTRRCGVGFTGLSDMIAMLGHKFDSEKSLKTIEHVMRVMFKAELDATIDLAISRGTFEGYSKEIEQKGNDWYKFVENNFPTEYIKMMNFGRRNLSFSTVAPTGTVSLMAQCSSGIEPLFAPYYIRRRKCMSENDRVDFRDKEGVAFTNFFVIHPTLKKWIKANYSDIDIDNIQEDKLREVYEKSPWFNSTAPDIDWKKRIEIQSICQKYITHSISSTVNLPNSTTEQEVSDIYMEAWKMKLKGQTVYRDGCRDGVLITKKEEKPKEIQNTKAPKRPKELEADYYEIKSKGSKYAILVGLFDKKPYEIFAFEMDKNMSIANHKGIIEKVGKGHYKFTSDKLQIENLLLQNDKTEEKASTLYTSMLLRHGINIKYIIKTARKVNENIVSFTSAICRVLAKYTEKEEIKGEVCPNCGGRLIREGGCIKCLDCDYSKCL